MDLLKRFEEDSLDDPGLIDQLVKSDDDQEQDDDDFMSRFGSLDLGKPSSTRPYGPMLMEITSDVILL